jgi:hypothetical protein
MRPCSVGFLLPVISKYIDLTVWIIVFRPCHSGKMPTHAVLKKSHMIPTDTQPYEFVSMNLSEIGLGGFLTSKELLAKDVARPIHGHRPNDKQR